MLQANMSTKKEMVQQIIKYSDGTETIINYNSLGSPTEMLGEQIVLADPIAEEIKVLTETVVEPSVSETPSLEGGITDGKLADPSEVSE